MEIDSLDIQSNRRVSERPQSNAIGNLWSTITQNPAHTGRIDSGAIFVGLRLGHSFAVVSRML